MTAPDRDELAGGADRDPVRLPTWVGVVGLALAVLVGWFVVARTSGSDDSAASAHGTPTPSTASADEPRVAPPEPVNTGYPPLEGPLRVIGGLCVQTPSPRSMIVEFEVENTGPDQVEVLALVAQGRSNGEIGRALYISTKTASVHVSNILRKLEVPSRYEAAEIAERYLVD